MDSCDAREQILSRSGGPYFAKAVANLIGMDPGPLPDSLAAVSLLRLQGCM